jgi:outer membrane protein assembly factor BamD
MKSNILVLFSLVILIQYASQNKGSEYFYLRAMLKKGVAAFLVLLLFASCSKYQKILKSTDIEAKYNAAVKYYEKKDYYRALPLFEELISVYRGQGKAENIYYYYSYCNYWLEDYELAAYHFETFANTFPKSQYAEECAFMHAYCFYKNSPEFSLDQESTVRAIAKFQIFVNRFQNSSRIEECNGLIDKLRFKLEEKSFGISKLYFNTGDYKAAITSFRNLLHDFPSTSFKEEAMFHIAKSYYLYAQNSIESRKNERFSAMIDAGNEFINSFPESRQSREIKALIENSKLKISKNKS